MKASKKFFVAILLGFSLAVTTFSLVTSCETVAVCGGTCTSSTPWSNDHTGTCYSTKSYCESQTGYTCTTCD
jgi:hypothetical protein